jgi:ribosomal protein S18 acetylase RimI-like enzyme
MIEIRQLRKNDRLDDLITLSREFFEEYENHHEDFFKIDTLSERDIIDYFSNWINNENGRVFIALSEGKVVGYITVYIKQQSRFWKVKKVGDISGLMVHKAYRRKGIATQLLSKAKSFFWEKGVRYFTVFTAVENLGAIKFYERSGLQPIYTTMVGDLRNTFEEQ